MAAGPIGSWAACDEGRRVWRRRLEGEEVFMTWQEVHKRGFMVLTAGFAYTVDDIDFDAFVRRIKRGWMRARYDMPMLACQLRRDGKGDYESVEYHVPDGAAEVERWADTTVLVKAKGSYDWTGETDGHPDRPEEYVAMLRILEQAGRLIDDQADASAHLVMFTVSHAMADIYTLCDIGRLMLEALGREEGEKENLELEWGEEIHALPTSINSAYTHFIGRPSVRDRKTSARYWGSSFLPLLRKQYCALPLNDMDHAAEAHHVLHQMSESESIALVAWAKAAEVSVTALTYGALAYEMEWASRRNGSSHCVGIVRNNRRFFPVPLKHEHPGSPAPAGTMTLLSLPLSDPNQDAQQRILALARAFSSAIKPHTDGSAAELGLANVEALTRPYMAMQQHRPLALLSWLPRIWSIRTMTRVLYAALTRSKANSAKPPPLAFSAHGNLDEVLPRRSGRAVLCGYHLFTRPGEDTLAVLTYTFHQRYYLRIVHNARFYDKTVIEDFARRSIDHLRSLTLSE